MALKSIEGFRWTSSIADLSAGEKWLASGTNGSIIPGNLANTSAYRSEGAGLDISSWLHKLTNVVTPTEKLIVGFRFRFNNLTDSKIMAVYNATFVRGSLFLRANGKLKWVFGDNVFDTGYSTVDAISINTWHYIEIEITAATTTAGQVKIYIDGNENASGTNIQTFETGTNSNAVAFMSETLADGQHDYMDIYIADSAAGGQVAAAIGDVQVVTAVPTAPDVVTGTEWDNTTDGGGNHYEALNELNVAVPTVLGDTDYNDTQGTGKEDRFVLAFPGQSLNVGDTIYGLQAQATLADRTTGAPDVELGILSESGGAPASTSEATKQPPDGSYGTYFHMVENDPDQGAGTAWTKTTAEAAEIFLRTI